MIIIVLCNEAHPWLQYIWEQFAEINELNTEYKVMTYSDYESSSYKNKNTFLIEYSIKKKYAYSLLIHEKKEFSTDDYIWVKDNLPVYRGTFVEDDNGNNYDILYNAFIHLSRAEEWEVEKNGRFICSFSFNHPRKNKRIWKFPVVNYLFNELEEKIKAKCPEVEFNDRRNPIIEFSHDVDYIEKTVPLRIKQSLFNFYNCGKLLLKPDLKKGYSKFISSVKFALTGCDYWCFERWAVLENKLTIKSVYYFYAEADGWNRFNPKRRLIDPSYNISKNERLREKCKELIANGNRIGLHGSYFSAYNKKLFLKEKETLEDAIDFPITKTRQHWLNYRENSTPYIHLESSIEEDSTLGFNDIPGFRAGAASQYNPYDHKNNKPFPFIEIPLLIMDSHLYDYSDGFYSNNLDWVIDSMKRVKKFMVSVDWHNRVISKDYSWTDGYTDIAAIIRDINK